MKSNLYAQLERIFHEPNRLAIMSALLASGKNCSFNELKDECSLTDGNLNRHLHTLSDAGAVRISKGFSENKPKTMVMATEAGRKDFLLYLQTLEKVLSRAYRAVDEQTAASFGVPWSETAEPGRN